MKKITIFAVAAMCFSAGQTLAHECPGEAAAPSQVEVFFAPDPPLPPHQRQTVPLQPPQLTQQRPAVLQEQASSQPTQPPPAPRPTNRYR